eukprot:sb/3470027/
MGVIESISRSYPLNRSSSRHIRPEPRHDLQTGVTPSQTVPITLQPALETLPITTKTQLRWLFNFDIIGCGIVNEKPGKLGGVQVVHDMFLVCELTRAEALSADETDCVTWQSVTEGNHSWAVVTADKTLPHRRVAYANRNDEKEAGNRQEPENVKIWVPSIANNSSKILNFRESQVKSFETHFNVAVCKNLAHCSLDMRCRSLARAFSTPQKDV